MTVERTHAGHQTRYELRDGAALVSVLTFRGREPGRNQKGSDHDRQYDGPG